MVPLKVFFSIYRGIRQGDLISPFLFIIMAKAFGRAIIKAQIERKIRGITVTEEVPKIIDQQFADATLLPGENTLEEAQNFKQIINNHMEALGQKVNANKSDFLY